MNTEPTHTPFPTVLFKKGDLTDAAKHELRKAGYCVVQANDTAAIKQFYPESFNDASNRAKIAAFDYAMGKRCLVCFSDLCDWYIHFLKKAGKY